MLSLVQVHLFKSHGNAQQSKMVYFDYPDLSTIRGRYQNGGDDMLTRALCLQGQLTTYWFFFFPRYS
jgi:hypothetical protein